MDINAVVANYRSALHAFLVSRLRNPDDADDLVQEVLAKTLQHGHTLQSDAKLKAWLFQVAHNALIDHHRKRQREAALDAGDLWYTEAPEHRQHAFAPCLDAFIQALPPDAGALLRAVELDGRSQKAVAAEHGLSYSTLKSRVQSARNHLRKLFDQCCAAERDAGGRVLSCAPHPATGDGDSSRLPATRPR
ncbi:MAG: sigma-70 family RNA polymerase sigma factor [Pseudomonadota bacterium]